jgi:glycosidase
MNEDPKKLFYPSLYEINTRVWLTELGRSLGRPATLDDIPDAELQQLAAAGFDWIWLLGVWQTGTAGQRLVRESPEWRRRLKEILPDLRDEDIAGSGFAVSGYHVDAGLGGDAALERLRKRLNARGLRLMLDFVPNHTALDHPWTADHPDYYIAGTEADLARTPENYTRIATARGNAILAHGRDPAFSGWTDTLQLDYANPALQEAMLGELSRIAGQCDGLRCDMAMLLLPEVFERTWKRRSQAFWPAAIRHVRERMPGFCFLAEVYWDLEWTLLQQGFDYAYDKRLYDRLREKQAGPVREHLGAGLDYQNGLARFLENHDEPRAATAFTAGMHQAAAIVTYLSPGLRFFHQGQLEGRKKRLPVQLIRAPQEAVDTSLQQFYTGLLAVLRQSVIRHGEWRLLQCAPAWDGNGSRDGFLAWLWQSPYGQQRLVAVNYAGNQGQCYVKLDLPELVNRSIRLQDLTSAVAYDRDGTDLVTRGLYLDLPAWGYHVFEVLMFEPGD